MTNVKVKVKDLFCQPYDHNHWITDQQVLILRLKELQDTSLSDIIETLEDFQKSNIASILTCDYVKSLLSEKGYVVT